METRLRRRQNLADTRRQLVLDAARSLFAQAGSAGASIREIARQAGYTPGAIYAYFDSKEAIYAALLGESLDRLQAVVQAARAPRQRPDRLLQARALAWFGFYAAHPRDLELGFHLAHGTGAQGLTPALKQQLDDRLCDALRPCETSLEALGLDPAQALSESTALFAHGLGLLMLQHAGQIGTFGQDAETLFRRYLDRLLVTVAELAALPAAAPGQADLFPP